MREMQNRKIMFVGLLLAVVMLTGIAGAVTTIPGGIVSSYSLNTAGETYKLGGNVVVSSTA